MKKILALFSLFLLIFSCDNREFTEDKIIMSYPFEFNVRLEKEYYIDEPKNIYLEIDNSKQTNDQEFFVAYEVMNSKNVVISRGEKKIEEKEEFSIKKGESIISFLGNEIGEYKIKFTARNKYEKYNQYKEITINIGTKEYEFFWKNEEEPLLEIAKKDAGQILMELKTEAVNDKYIGRISSVSKDRGYFMYNHTKVNYDEDFQIIKGNTRLEYYPTVYGTGKHQMDIKVLDVAKKEPKEKPQSISFNVYKEMEIVNVLFDRTWKKEWHGLWGTSKYDMEYFVSYELDMKSKLTEVIIKGYDKRNKKLYKISLPKILKISLENYKFEFIYNTSSPQDFFEPGDEMEIIFKDDKGYEISEKLPMKNKE